MAPQPGDEPPPPAPYYTGPPMQYTPGPKWTPPIQAQPVPTTILEYRTKYFTDKYGQIGTVIIPTVVTIATYSDPYTTSTTTIAFQDNTPPATPIISTRRPERTGEGGRRGGHRDDGPPKHIYAAAGAITALLIVGLVLLCVFLICKKRKSKARGDGMQMAERAQAKPVVAAHISSDPAYAQPPREPPPALLDASSSSSLPSTRSPNPPVIITRAMDTSYYTGIDTSDHVSLADNRRSVGIYPDGQDEPPPPYRPASVPPISRDNSMRVSNSFASPLDRGLMQRNSIREVRSPFDDPEEEVSDIEDEDPATSTPDDSTSQREADRRSQVSDLEYQEETRPHSNL